ncbi:MAG: patatin-like phospholipase family protein [Bacillota bacterium]
MKTGMVLEGGGMRGLYTAGVLDVFMENNIKVDGVIGVSAGATFGCNYKSRQIGRALRYNLKYCKDPRYNSLRSLLKTGDLFGAEFCYQTIPNRLDIFDTEAYQKNPVNFYVTCTDVETGQPVYQLCNNGGAEDIEWMRASASLPIAARIVEIDGGKYLDGGISDSIPLEALNNLGYKHNIVILTQPQDYRKQKNSLLPLIKLKMKKYPAIIECMANRHLRYNRELDLVAEYEQAGHTLVIRPSRKLSAGRTEKDPKKLQETYDLGRRDAQERLSAVKEFLAKQQ